MKIDPARLGKVLREVRLSKKMSLRKTAAMAGVSETYLCLLEKGERGASLETLNTLAEVLDVPAVLLTFLCTEPKQNGRFNKLVQSTQSAIRAAIEAQAELQNSRVLKA
jgi:transcriptional regulator with XRE-family HTH domain